MYLFIFTLCLRAKKRFRRAKTKKRQITISLLHLSRFLLSPHLKLRDWSRMMLVCLIPLNAVVFGRIDREFLSEGFWNATTLKMTLSVTPLLLLLTFHTKIVTLNELTNFQRVTKCSLKTIVNTLDGTELVYVLSDESLCDHETSQAYVQEYTYCIYL